MNEKDIELLKYVYQTADIGRDNLFKINDRIGDGELRRTVERYILTYKSLCDRSASKLSACGEDAKSGSALPKAMAAMTITVKTMVDSSESHVAEMLMQGFVMGIIEGVKKLKEYSGCNDDALNLVYKLLWVSECGFDEMKHFL